jgi:hypothetical protein
VIDSRRSGDRAESQCRESYRFGPPLIPWRDLAAIEFNGVDSKVWDISNMYYALVFERHDGSRVTAEAPGGGTRPRRVPLRTPGTPSRHAIRGPGGSPCTGGPAIRCRQHGRKQPRDTNRHPSTTAYLATPRHPFKHLRCRIRW